MASIRTFIAVDVAPSIIGLAQKQIRQLQAAGAEYKWVDPKNMHLTLKFLGNMRDHEIPEICQRVERAVQTIPPISLTIVGLGAFPKLERPRVIWMGIDSGKEELVELQRAIDDGLRPMGFQLEKNDFQPHITLGRVSSGSTWTESLQQYLAAHEATNFGGFEIDEVIVYSSFVDRFGPTYTPMATLELAGK